MEKFNFIVKDNFNVRIDKYLSLVQSDITRSKIQNLIKENNVLVNNEFVSPNYKVKENDCIEVNIPKINTEGIVKENIQLNILYEDEDLIVVDKPKGMVTHPAVGNYTGTLVNGLVYHFNELSNNDDEIRPGIVHRIDKNTSGCLIVCKNDNAHNIIAEQIKSKKCKRTYIALVHGIIEHETGTINAPIARSKKDRQKMCVTSLNAKDAITHFEVIKRFSKYTLVKCKLETGRTHQIRVHMQYINHPIVGDDKYSYLNTRKDTNGQMLHACMIEFYRPKDNKKIVVESKLPQYFEDILKEI